MEFIPVMLPLSSIITGESCTTVPPVPSQRVIALSVEEAGPVTLAILFSFFAGWLMFYSGFLVVVRVLRVEMKLKGES